MDSKRKQERVPTRLAIRFGSAVEFVSEYAENLSTNGLFIRGSHNVALLDEITIDVTLPGLGSYSIKARVAHILTPEVALKFGRQPGLGVEIVQRPAGFTDAMSQYMQRLGRRRDATVVVHDDEPRALITELGYKTKPAPIPSELLHWVEDPKEKIIAVVIPPDGAGMFRKILDRIGRADLVQILDGVDKIDDFVHVLDALI